MPSNREAVTAGDGTARFDDVAAGTYDVVLGEQLPGVADLGCGEFRFTAALATTCPRGSQPCSCSLAYQVSLHFG